MTSKALWSRILISVGGAAMLIGAIDPLEGSLLILPGSGLVALGVFLGTQDRRVVRYALWVFILIFSGVSAMFALSALGGVGGPSGVSIWWSILVLPYPVGWLMALVGVIVLFARGFRADRPAQR